MSEGSPIGVQTGGDAFAADAPQIPAIGVGMLGYAFMGKAHANAYRTLAYVAPSPPYLPRLVSIAGRTESSVQTAARRFGFERAVTDWRDLVADPEVELFDNSGPNDLHGAPTIAAAVAGKHVVCEKPLGRDAEESYEIWQRVQATGVVNLCAFNYRFVPAVRYARQLIDEGFLGTIHHFRARYLQDWGATEAALWRFDRDSAGSGALGDLGTHVIDIARFLVGEFATVSAVTATFQPGREVDDAIEAAVQFERGIVGTIEATRFATGNRNGLSFEINGSDGTIAFDMNQLNELRISEGGKGFRTQTTTDPGLPFQDFWWPPGHIIGWGDTFVHELEHLLGAIRGRNTVAPYAATFEDGYRAAEVGDAIVRSAKGGSREAITYR